MQIHGYYHIAGHYLCALINNDYSGLTDKDIEDVEVFDQALPDRYTIHVVDNSASFARDEISGLMADCEYIAIYEA